MLTEFETKVFRSLLAAKKNLEIFCRKKNQAYGEASVHRAFHEMLAKPGGSDAGLRNTPAAKQWIKFAVKTVYQENKDKIEKLPLSEAELLIATLCKKFFYAQLRFYLDIEFEDADHPVHGRTVSIDKPVGKSGEGRLADVLRDEE